MKNLLTVISCLLLFVSFSVIAQTDIATETPTDLITEPTAEVKDTIIEKVEVFEVVEEMPAYVGGEKKLLSFLDKNMRYPSDALVAQKQGIVTVSFVVFEDGSLNEINVENGIFPSLDEEAKRLVAKMPNFTVGKQNGVPVRVKHSLPINFKIDRKTIKRELKRKVQYFPKEDGVYTMCEQNPEFPGGLIAFMGFVNANKNYPEEFEVNGIGGKVVVSFIVETDGSLTNFKVIRGVNETLDAEAVRVLKTMPRWQAGVQNGVKVRVRFNAPVEFGKKKPRGAK